MRTLNIVKSFNMPYNEAYILQEKLLKARQKDEIEDTLFLTSHPHVYTFGAKVHADNLLVTESYLKKHGISLYHTNRGGDITYHGPGQVMGYPIIKLSNCYTNLHKYVLDTENVIIKTLKNYGIDGTRSKENPGVWIGNKKICAIGIAVRRWVTMHGFALNVNTELKYFDNIIPCGLKDKGVISMEIIVGRKLDINKVSDYIIDFFMDVFCIEKAYFKSLSEIIKG